MAAGLLVLAGCSDDGEADADASASRSTSAASASPSAEPTSDEPSPSTSPDSGATSSASPEPGDEETPDEGGGSAGGSEATPTDLPDAVLLLGAVSDEGGDDLAVLQCPELDGVAAERKVVALELDDPQVISGNQAVTVLADEATADRYAQCLGDQLGDVGDLAESVPLSVGSQPVAIGITEDIGTFRTGTFRRGFAVVLLDLGVEPGADASARADALLDALARDAFERLAPYGG